MKFKKIESDSLTRRSVLKTIGGSVIFSVLPLSVAMANETKRIDNSEQNKMCNSLDYISINPEDTGEALINPGMGWVTHYYSGRTGNYGYKLEPSDSLDWFPGCSVIYMRIPWAYIEPEEGFFNWTVFDTPAQRFIAKGKKMALRINPCEHWLAFATPKWVKEAGAKGVNFTHGEGPSENGQLWDPDYLDPIFLEKFENLIKALADRYDGNPNVAWVELGIGLWGEGWKIYSSPSREVNDQIVRIQIDLYVKYFKKTLICINDDMLGSKPSKRNISLIDYALTKGLIFRDDSILVNKYPKAWYSEDLAAMFSEKERPILLETGHYGMLKEKGTWEENRLMEAVETFRCSYLSLHWWPHEFYKDNKRIIEKINKRLGYRIRLLEFKYPKVVEIGERFRINWKWANAGVAPCYHGGFPALTIKDKKGGIVSLLVDNSIDLGSLKSGSPDNIPDKEFTSTFNIGFLNPKEFFNDFTSEMEQRPGSEFFAAPVLPRTEPGKYEIFVSVGAKDGTPIIALPLIGNDGQRRYKLGELIVKKPLLPGFNLGDRYKDH